MNTITINRPVVALALWGGAMSTLRDAAQQALEEWHTAPGSVRMASLMMALEAALAEPEQEQAPVAWRTFDGEGGYDYRTYEDDENYRDEYIKRNGEKYASWVEPLYTSAPTPRKSQPVGINGLTEAETDASASVKGLVGKPEQKPVAWMCSDESLMHKGYSRFSRTCEGAWNIPVYTAPTPRKPLELTDGEIKLLMDGRGEEGDDDYVPSAFDDFGISEDDLMRFARAVIAAYEAKQGEQT